MRIIALGLITLFSMTVGAQDPDELAKFTGDYVLTETQTGNCLHEEVRAYYFPSQKYFKITYTFPTLPPSQIAFEEYDSINKGEVDHIFEGFNQYVVTESVYQDNKLHLYNKNCWLHSGECTEKRLISETTFIGKKLMLVKDAFAQASACLYTKLQWKKPVDLD